MNKFNLLILAILTIASCEPNIMFEQPMPPSQKLVEKLPDDIQGIFTWELDESILIIDEYNIYKEYWYTSTIHLSKVEETESCNIMDGGIYHTEMEECIPFEYIDENVIKSTVIEVDTLFSFGPNQLAKSVDGNLFLNYQDEDGLWTTHVIKMNDDGSLTWEVMHLPEQSEIESIMKDFKTRERRDSSLTYIVNPDKNQFNLLLSNGYTAGLYKLFPYNLEESMPKSIY